MITDKYYIKEVDTEEDSIYCHHDLMGELLIPKHQHNKSQMLYTEGGIVYIKTPNKTYFLPARHFMWIPAGISHSIHPSSEDVMMRNLYFPVEKNDPAIFLKEGIYPVNDVLLQMLLFTNRWNGNLEKDSRNYTIASAIKALLPDVCDKNLSLAVPIPKDVRLSKLVAFVDENLAEDIKYTEIAERFGFSERTLHRLFKKDMGISFIQYFTLKRILKALELLIEKKESVNEVAHAVGYNSVPTFSNTFYKFLGQRPSDYLKGQKILKK